MAFAAPAAAQQLYRWVDEQGKVHYSDQMPPQAAESDRRVLDGEGRTREQARPGASAEARERALRERAEREAAQAEREEEARRDRNLLATYASVTELEQMRDERLEEQRAKLQQVQAGGRTVSPTLSATLAQRADTLAATEQRIAENEAEQARIRERFAADIERFKALRGE
jgi:hypothetical protein